MDMQYLNSEHYFRQGDRWVYNMVNEYAHPDLMQWPVLESYFDVFWLYPMHEGMVQAALSFNAYTWGYLAARPPTPPPN